MLGRMATADSAFDRDLAGATIEATELVDGIVLASVRVNEDEASAREAVYGALGVGGRPLPLDDDGAAEAVCARSSDGLPVLAARDLRIEQGRATAPAEGTIYAAGYYGAELRFDVVAGEQRSTATLTDNAGRVVVLDDQGVRVPSSPLIQGDPLLAQDVALAAPLIEVLIATYAALTAAASALSSLGAPIDISQLTLKIAPYLVPGSPSAPTTRAPDLRGAPGT